MAQRAQVLRRKKLTQGGVQKVQSSRTIDRESMGFRFT
jgi:hypothetical protein